MLVVGLTGGIATGKSTVGKLFAELGAYRIDTDMLARQVVEPGEPAYVAIVHFFGEGIIGPDGRLDRQRLAAAVFSDPKKLDALNKMTHPPVRTLLQAKLEQARSEGECIVLVEVPLLYEAGFDRDVDCVVVVFTDEQTQLARLMARNGFSEDEARQRILAQMPVAEKAARADYVIDNSKAPDNTKAQVTELWHTLRQECLHG
ncbi:MAG: dephospho-CoA kinase [Bacillota bacterium]|nr:dephospho-CoA kinase [Bacillota bacterium]MDW7683271.1 dephospho-CoA kinase [Bacillota bacterium]